MKEDIIAGLKNAVERGYSLDEAAQTFINAGYNPVEIKEAINSLSMNATSITNQNKHPYLQEVKINQNNNSNPKKKRGVWKVVLLIILFLLLIGGLVAAIIFSSEIINFLKTNL